MIFDIRSTFLTIFYLVYLIYSGVTKYPSQLSFKQEEGKELTKSRINKNNNCHGYFHVR